MDALAQRLRLEREQQRLSVRDVSIVTKIREPYIEAIEAGRYDVLPAVYVRSFIKTLAEALGIPRVEIVRLMEEQFDLDGEVPERLPRAISKPQTEPSSLISDAMQMASKGLERPVDAVRNLASSTVLREALRRKNAYLYIGSAVVVVAALVYLLVFYTGNKKEVITEAPDVEVSVEGVEAVAESDSLVLTASVIDTAWLTITADGIRTQQLLLIPDEDYSWSASKKFTLSISNAGGVRFIRNGRALPKFGEAGEAVRSVTITRSEVINTSEKPVALPTKQAVQPATETKKPAIETKKPVVETKKPEQTAIKPTTTKPPSTRPVKRAKRPDIRSVPLITTTPTRSPIQRPTEQKPPR